MRTSHFWLLAFLVFSFGTPTLSLASSPDESCPIPLNHSEKHALKESATNQAQIQEILQKVYRSVYNNSNVFEPGNCSSNIWRLLRVFATCGITLSRAKVLYINEPNLKVILEHTRKGVEQWFFHVVLQANDQIFDFDFGPEPTTPSTSVYFEKTFKSLLTQEYGRLAVRIIPAEEYREIYRPDDFERNFYYFLLPENSTYPESKVIEFVDKI